jgi:hypothetical protein
MTLKPSLEVRVLYLFSRLTLYFLHSLLAREEELQGVNRIARLTLHYYFASHIYDNILHYSELQICCIVSQ